MAASAQATSRLVAVSRELIHNQVDEQNRRVPAIRNFPNISFACEV
jgi:hypothetical protein